MEQWLLAPSISESTNCARMLLRAKNTENGPKEQKKARLYLINAKPKSSTYLILCVLGVWICPLSRSHISQMLVCIFCVLCMCAHPNADICLNQLICCLLEARLVSNMFTRTGIKRFTHTNISAIFTHENPKSIGMPRHVFFVLNFHAFG